MTSHRILIVEDDALQAISLQNQISDLNFDGQIKVLEPVDNRKQAIEFLKREKPEIAILDIELHDDKEGGIMIAKEIQECNLDIVTIFLTALDDHIGYQKAKHIKHFRFLRKSFDEGALKRALTSAIIELKAKQENKHVSEDKHVFFKPHGEDVIWIKTTSKEQVISHNRVSTKDIIYLEADDQYLMIHINNDTKSLYSKAGGLGNFYEANLNYYPFFHIHRSFVINANFIVRISGNQVIIQLRDKSTLAIPVGKTKRHLIMTIMGEK